jgi:hypothetical protein
MIASSAHADPGAEPEAKREVPDYDGRGNPDAKPSSALWVPRIVLAPVYAAHEYLIRRPFGVLVETAERHEWVERVEDFFAFGPDHSFMVYPTVAYDFGLLPSVGASLHWKHALIERNTFSAHFGTWGDDWIATHADDTYTWDHSKMAETTRAAFVRQLDNLFYGVGPDVTSATKSRYGLDRFDATQMVKRKLAGESALSLTVGARDSELRSGTCCSDPSLSDLIASGAEAMPPGYDASHMTVYEHASLRLDSRDARPAPGTGAYLELHGEDQVDVNSGDTWVRYGGTAGVAVDVNGLQRNIKFLVSTEMVDPVGPHSDVPFYELAQLGGEDFLTGFLGGEDTMSGFLRGWMNGRSVITGGVAYTWPVWTWLDGQARVSVGNAFDEHLEGFSPDKLRLSADIGLASNSARNDGIELVIGAGTETFEQGGRITSVRIAIGTRRGL